MNLTRNFTGALKYVLPQNTRKLHRISKILDGEAIDIHNLSLKRGAWIFRPLRGLHNLFRKGKFRNPYSYFRKVPSLPKSHYGTLHCQTLVTLNFDQSEIKSRDDFQNLLEASRPTGLIVTTSSF